MVDLQVVGNVTEDVRDGDLEVKTNSCHGIGFETSEAKCANHGWCI